MRYIYYKGVNPELSMLHSPSRIGPEQVIDYPKLRTKRKQANQPEKDFKLETSNLKSQVSNFRTYQSIKALLKESVSIIG